MMEHPLAESDEKGGKKGRNIRREDFSLKRKKIFLKIKNENLNRRLKRS
jgi:hypothetical protein